MGDSLYEMSVFSKVVAAGSLSAAARELGVSTAVVSRTLAALEARLGVRLINRTTRSLHLTDEGASYYEACSRILAEIEEADAAAAARRVEPQGMLRVALPASFGHKHIAPLIPPFAARYPKIQLALSLSDRTVNLIEEGFDLAIRIAELKDSSLAARKLAPNRRVVCASPDYLRDARRAATPEDLPHHNCLTTTGPAHDLGIQGTRAASAARCASPAATPATTGKCCANGRWPASAWRSSPPGTCAGSWRTARWCRCCPATTSAPTSDLRGLPAPAPPAGEDAGVHRLPRRVLRARAVLGPAAERRQRRRESKRRAAV